jgi:hypothetical protein
MPVGAAEDQNCIRTAIKCSHAKHFEHLTVGCGYLNLSTKVLYEFMQLLKFLIFFIFLLTLSSLIMSFIYSLLLFLKYLLVSFFTMFTLSVYCQ